MEFRNGGAGSQEEAESDDMAEVFRAFERQPVQPASGRSKQAERRASGGRVKPKQGGTVHPPITDPIPLCWKPTEDGKFQKYQQPPELCAKGWRLWPSDKITEVGTPKEKAPIPDLFSTRMLNKEPDQNNFIAWQPNNNLDKIERKAKAADRYAQRAVVHFTLGYFRDEEVTKESLTKERLAAVTENLQLVFGEGIEWSRAQVMTWAPNELDLVGNELLHYELKLNDYLRFNEVRPHRPSPRLASSCRCCRAAASLALALADPAVTAALRPRPLATTSLAAAPCPFVFLPRRHAILPRAT